HSVEHFLLEGFQRNLPDNFVSVGIMGCRTGFYLVFSNEGRAASISSALEDILTRMQNARAVPYARIDQCGDYRNHNLALAQEVAREVLKSKATWLDAV
ncbi:S-ribosylhomocysteinase (LuxS), partial [mine drainage metagenome]